MTMTAWVELLSDYLHSTRSKKQLRDLIVNHCTSGMCFGTYIVDGEKVWDLVVKTDPECMKWAEKKRIANAIGAESWYEERSYRDMRSTFPGKPRRKG